MQATLTGHDDGKPVYTIYHQGRVYHLSGEFYTLLRDRDTVYEVPVSIMHSRYHKLRAKIDLAVNELESLI